jgi:hypothetical protein
LPSGDGSEAIENSTDVLLVSRRLSPVMGSQMAISIPSRQVKHYLEDAYVRIGRMIRELKIPRETVDKK